MRSYTTADIALRAEIDTPLHGTLSGTATKKIMERSIRSGNIDGKMHRSESDLNGDGHQSPCL